MSDFAQEFHGRPESFVFRGFNGRLLEAVAPRERDLDQGFCQTETKTIYRFEQVKFRFYLLFAHKAPEQKNGRVSRRKLSPQGEERGIGEFRRRDDVNEAAKKWMLPSNLMSSRFSKPRS